MGNKKRKGFRRSKQRPAAVKSKPNPNRPAVRKQYSDQQMLEAMESVKKGMSRTAAAELHGVPLSTLKDRFNGRVVHGVKPGPRSYLSKDEEGELADFLVECARLGYGKTRRDVRCIVESYLQKHKSKPDDFTLSNGWWTNFLKRNPQLRLRAGDATANVRMDALSKRNLNHYFDLLKAEFDKYNFYGHPEAIYNMDETGVPLEPRPPKIVAKKGQKKVRYRTSGTKAQITVVGCGSATGQILPPFIIFAAKQINPQWCTDEVSGTRYAVSDNGWIDQELFHYWLDEHFLSNATPHRPLLLLLDGHSSHFEPTSIEYAKRKNVIIFCLPPHTTHECQPLDVSLFSALKAHWREECHRFYRKNPGLAINKLNFCSVFKKAWLAAVIPANVCSGFKKTGVFPFNRDAVKPTTTDSGSGEEQDADAGHGSVTVASSEAGQQEFDPDEERSNTNCDDSSDDGSVWEDATVDVIKFSLEEELRFTRWFEEDYDLPNSKYNSWLQLYHPEACIVTVPESTLTSPLLLSEPGSSSSSDNDSDSSDPATCLGTSIPPPKPHDTSSGPPVTPRGTSSGSPATPRGTSSGPPATPRGTSSGPPATPRGTSSGSPATPCSSSSSGPQDKAKGSSPLSSFLKIPALDKAKKTGKARVLTSDECLRIMQEKERKKREVAEDKEKRRLENLEKKKLREEEKKKKSEETARKKAEKEAEKAAKEAEKAANKAAREAAKAAKQAEKAAKEVTRKQTRAGTKRRAEGENSSTNKRKRPELHSAVLSDKCCVCFGNYEDDAGTDREWLQCKCLRWIHEDCVDYEDSSPDGGLCPLC